MKFRLNWSNWNIAAKILVPFLTLSIVIMAVIAYVAINNIRTLGDHALQTSTSLGKSAIADSTETLTRLGEDTIKQIANDVAKQVELYLQSHPLTDSTAMRDDAGLRRIAIQPVGTTGYTTLLDPVHSQIVVHKYLEQEKDISSLKDRLPSFWNMLQDSARGPVSGYYNWQEVDGSITQKYAAIVPINSRSSATLTLWATTYIEEFSQPVKKTEGDITTAIGISRDYISNSVRETQNAFAVLFFFLIVVVVSLSLLISRVITTPIHSLQAGAQAIGAGDLEHELKISNRDEIGKLAETFDKMRVDLKKSLTDLKLSADQNLASERDIQENLRVYVQKVSHAQEAERKRIARELHDETIQELIVISRQLDDLADGIQDVGAEAIRQRVQKVIQELHHFSQELRPSILDDLGLIPALKALGTDLSKNYHIEVEINVSGTPVQLKTEWELTLFRIVQEALTNVRKHSQATRANVEVHFWPDLIELTVRDNGTGFAVPHNYNGLTHAGRLGLVGIQERVQLLGGKLTIESHLGKGTTLYVRVPSK